MRALTTSSARNVRLRLARLAGAAILTVVATLSCGDGGTEPPPPDPPRPTTVSVSPATAQLTALGATVQLGAEVRDQNGSVMAGATVNWSSTAPAVAAVDASGLVTAAGNGTATITATSGPASGSAMVTVTQSAGSVVVSPRADTVAVGDTLRLAAETFDDNGHVIAGAELTWSSSDPSMATVDASGLVTGLAEGTTTITAMAEDASGTSEITVENPDRAALVALYNATDGPNWANNENWLSDVPLGEWYGVDTDESGWVVELTLAGHWDDDAREWVRHGLEGPIPPELGNLANLRTLDLGSNELTGPIPRELGSLTDLTRLGLSHNALSGPIPPELGNLANLSRLDLRVNNLSGPIPPELGNLSELGHLSLRSNRLTGPIPPELGNLSELSWLALWDNRLTGPVPSELGSLSSLTILYLSSNQFSGRIPPELGKLGNLRQLTLRGNSLTGPIPPQLGDLANLTWMTLANNRLTGPVPPELGNLVNLKAVFLSYNSNLVGALPETLTSLTALETLAFNDTDLCAPQTTEFEMWLRGIADVSGDDCPIVQEGDHKALAAIHRWTNGGGWRNNENWLSDAPLDDWYGVTADSTDRVTTLDLTDNGLAGILPAEAGGLIHLKELALSGNTALAGELPPRMPRLVFLSTLRLDGTGLCVPGMVDFRDWLAGIEDARVAPCPDDHGNGLSGATEVSLGEVARGEIESYQDEDWFRIDVPGRGKLTLKAGGGTHVVGELYSGEGELVAYDYSSHPSFLIVNRRTPGPHYIRVRGAFDHTRGDYTVVSSFEPRTPGARAYLTQATQSHDFAVPLVANEDALLRVFVMADSGVEASMPPVRATFYRGGLETHSVGIEGSTAQVPQTMAEGDLDATANAVIPARVLAPGTEMVVEVDPDGTLDSSLGIGGRIPEEGRMALDIRAMPDFHVTAVPFLWTEDPDSSGFKAAQGLTADHDVFYETRDWLPVVGMEVAVREAVLVDYDPKENMGRVLDDVALVHAADGASGYYMGVPPWIERGILGIARLNSKVSVSRFEGHTVAHEFGHNFSLNHAPCGNPGRADGRYPHARGVIGTWGYDARNGRLVDPEIHTDLMTYCRANDWISDYSFKKALQYRTDEEASMASDGRVLLVRGGVAEGRLRIEPAFVLDARPKLPERGGAYSLTGSDAEGTELFALNFAMQGLADVEDEATGGFTFAIPARAEWADELAAITLSGPEGSVALSAGDMTSPATSLVLDAVTGRVRAILRETPLGRVAADGDLRGAQGSVTLFSRGIPDPVAWRR